jgi:hypothetical protein
MSGIFLLHIFLSDTRSYCKNVGFLGEFEFFHNALWRIPRVLTGVGANVLA